MRHSKIVAGIALMTAIAVPSTGWAWGIPGCTNLPEYNRALGALQGMTSTCDMSVEQARRIIAAHGGVPIAVAPQAAATPAAHYRHRIVRRRHKATHARRHAAR